MTEPSSRPWRSDDPLEQWLRERTGLKVTVLGFGIGVLCGVMLAGASANIKVQLGPDRFIEVHWDKVKKIQKNHDDDDMIHFSPPNGIL